MFSILQYLMSEALRNYMNAYTALINNGINICNEYYVFLYCILNIGHHLHRSLFLRVSGVL